MRRPLPTSLVLCTLTAGLLGSREVFAQEILHDLPGASPGDLYGTRVTSGGDVDGDGASDLLITTRRDPGTGTTAWAVEVRSGATGALVRTHDAAGTEFLGAATLFLGDANGDGVDDYLCDAPDATAGTHTALLFSGADGSLLRTYSLTVSPSIEYPRLRSLGDLDGDGIRDFASADSNGAGGHVDVVLAGSGQITRTITDSNPYWGSALATVPDRDGDGKDDLAVGDLLWSVSKGSVWIFSSATGAVVTQLYGQIRDLFGSALARVEDLTGDGVDDLLIGAPHSTGSAPVAGAVYVYSGATLGIHAFVPGSITGGNFGAQLADAGDVNGDGVHDLLIGSPTVPTWLHSGPAWLVSGANFGTLYRFEFPDTTTWSEDALTGTGDLDGDGLGDFAFGDPQDGAPAPAAGHVQVFRGNDLYLLATPRVVAPNDALALAAREGTTSQYAMIAAVDVSGVPLFWILSKGFFSSTGEHVLQGTVPPSVTGVTITFLALAQRSPRGARLSAPEVLTIQ